jgi:hypothetical protein
MSTVCMTNFFARHMVDDLRTYEAWSGPWHVIEKEDNDPAHPIMLLQHIASKKIERFNASMCKRCN